jgi:hypothetical protein
MKSVRERMDINAVFREVGTLRATAEICGTTPKTVKRAVARAEAEAQAASGPVGGPQVEPAHNYDGVADVVAERVARTQGRISAKRLLPVARTAGYGGSARNFRRLVAAAKTECGRTAIGAGGRGCGRRGTCWSSTGVRSVP